MVKGLKLRDIVCETILNLDRVLGRFCGDDSRASGSFLRKKLNYSVTRCYVEYK